MLKSSFLIYIFFFASLTLEASSFLNLNSVFRYFGEVPLDDSFKIKEYSSSRNSKIDLSQSETRTAKNENILFYLGDVPPSAWESFKDSFSRTYLDYQHAWAVENFRRQLRFRYNRWLDMVEKTVNDPNLNLPWTMIQGNYLELKELATGENAPKNIIILCHADAEGKLHSDFKVLKRDYFDDFSEKIQSLGIFTCFFLKIKNQYNFGFLEKNGNMDRKLLFFPDTEDDEIEIWKTKSFLLKIDQRLFEISR